MCAFLTVGLTFTGLLVNSGSVNSLGRVYRGELWTELCKVCKITQLQVTSNENMENI